MEVPAQTTRRAYEEAVWFFLSTVERVRPDQWGAPGLGEWSVRDLVGHATRTMLSLESFLASAADGVDIPSAVDYLVTILSVPGSAARVAQAGREAGAALGDDPRARVREIGERILPQVAAAADDLPVAAPAGRTRLIDFLPTRVLELVTHTLDLATALDLRAEPPAEAMRLVVGLVGELAVRKGDGPRVLFALTGRGALPDGYSLL